MRSKSRSLITFIILSVSIWYCVFKEYPTYNAYDKLSDTISWDTYGYYYYLPAIFIYNDLKQLGFKDSINAKYEPTSFYQANKAENGNYVLQYSCGQAISYFPFFIVGHVITKYFLKYPPDGFSKPYQFWIALCSLFFTILGLWFSRKILLKYFDETITSLTLITLVLITNYLDYTVLDGPMTHNYLYTYYAILIFLTIRYHEQAKRKTALFIGLTIGILSLTRPSEIISCLIPILWGVNIFSKASLHARWLFIKLNYKDFIIAAIACALVGSIQLIYWKYVSGNWLYYSYKDQGFSWLSPHLMDGIFSYRRGWLLWTPVMIFAIVGIYLMKRIPAVKPLISVVTIFLALFLYIAFAWDIWWYGGSMGQRTMVQSYALLIIPLAAFFNIIWHKFWPKLAIGLLLLVFFYFNLWWTFQFHFGRYYWAEVVNGRYFWEVLGKVEFDENDLKLMDTSDRTIYKFKTADVLYINDFEQDTVIKDLTEKPIQGNHSYYIDPKVKYTPEFCFKPVNTNYHNYRAKASFKCIWKENNPNTFAQFKIMFKDHSNIIKTNFIRLDRFYSNGETKMFFFDTKAPNLAFDEICVQLLNADGNDMFLIDEVKVEGFIVD